MLGSNPSSDIPLFIGIGTALSRSLLQVPKYQRNYAWETENIQELFDDLANAINDKDEGYFLGSIVTVRTQSNRLEVVDGQQRLATISILLAAMRDYFIDTQDLERAIIVEQSYLSKKDMTLEKTQNLELNSTDNEFFLEAILNNSSNAGTVAAAATHTSNMKLAAAKDLAKKCVQKIVSQTKDPTARIIDWIEFIKSKVQVVWFTVPSEANAFIIFETLNDRGLALTVSDLLKNYLFSHSQKRLHEVEPNWSSVTYMFETMDNDDALVRYIHNFWSSRYGLTRERELFNSIKRQITSPAQVVGFSSDLLESAQLYAAILSPDHEKWEQFPALLQYQIKENITSLNALKLTQYRTLLLAILRKFTDDEVVKSLSAIVSWTVRFIVSGGGGGTLEKFYPEVAKEISNDSVKTADDLFNRMQNILPNDQVFRANFATISIAKPHIARHLLESIEKYIRTGHESELVPSRDTSAANLEHVLPQTISPASWPHFTQEDHKVYLNRLGNQTLLGSKNNSRLKNSAFSAKLVVYGASEFIITKELTEWTEWTRDAIESRQLKLADLALKVWKYKPLP